jgi:hypothetical protein
MRTWGDALADVPEPRRKDLRPNVGSNKGGGVKVGHVRGDGRAEEPGSV